MRTCFGLQTVQLRRCCLQATCMAAYTADDVVGLLDADCSYIDSNDDDLGFEIEEYENPCFHAEPSHTNGRLQHIKYIYI